MNLDVFLISYDQDPSKAFHDVFSWRNKRNVNIHGGGGGGAGVGKEADPAYLEPC